MAGTRLTDDEIERLLVAFPGWERDGVGLRRRFEFANFTEAFGFMTGVAAVSETLFHHPDWSNSYNRVDVSIVDHDAGGISTTDREWITSVETITR